MKQVWIILCSLVLISCSGESEPTRTQIQQRDHVWKDMTDTIDKAMAVDPLVEDAAERQRRAIEAATE